MTPGTERAIQRLGEWLPSQLKELSQAISSLNETLTKKKDEGFENQVKEGRSFLIAHSGNKQVTLILTSEEWTELTSAIHSKIASVEKGDYVEVGEEDDAEKWSADLKALSKKVEDQLHAQNVEF